MSAENEPIPGDSNEEKSAENVDLESVPEGSSAESELENQPESERGPERACLDCGKILTNENFCPHCGQKNAAHKLTLREFVYETLGSFFAFDSRWLATLRVLILKPGKLARAYADGQRTRFAPPLRVFLWSLIMTLIIDDSRFLVEPEIQEGADGFVDGIQGDSTAIDIGPDTLDLPDHAMAYPDLNPSIGLKRIGMEDSWRNQKFYAFFQNLQKQGGGGFSEFIKKHLVVMLLLFVPFLALWLKLLYLRKGIYFLEHATFVFYAHAMLFLLILIAEIGQFFIDYDFMNILFWIYILHLYLSFVGFYGESRFKSAVKMALSSLGFVVLVILFVVGVWLPPPSA